MYLTCYVTAHNSEFLSRKNTGLGNVLFEIACCYAIAKQTDREPVWNKVVLFGDKLKTIFGFQHKDTIFRKLKKTIEVSFETKRESDIWRYDPSLLCFLQSNRSPVEIHGHFECLYYFNEYKSDIQDLFSPDEDSFRLIQSTFPILFDPGYTPVSLHFRGNEYIRQANIANPWDYGYYRRAVAYIKEHVKNPIFLIFSDDMESIDFSFLESVPYKKMGHTEDYIDLWCQSFCKHHILSRSTFSFWGAYLNRSEDGIVLYDKNFKKPYHDLFHPI